MPRAEQATELCRFTRTDDGRYALAGDLGFESAARILAEGEAAFAGRAEVAVDLSAVTDADSAGLAVLIEWTRGSHGAGRRISFLGMPERLGAMAQIGGVSKLLPIES